MSQAFSASRSARLLCTLAALASALMVFGCSTPSGHPAAPRSVASPDYNYIIGPADSMSIIVWRNGDLSTSVTVRPDGKITVPLVEDVPAMGKNSTQLARDIEKALSKYIRDPVVTIILTGFVGPYSEQIRVVGEAAKPQALPYRQNMTLLDVMIVVGGITDFADGNKATLLRTSEKNKLYSIRLRDLLKRGDMNANVDVKPGDVVVIPQSWF